MLPLVFSHIFCIFAVFVTVLSFKTFVHSNHIVLYALATFGSLYELTIMRLSFLLEQLVSLPDMGL